MKKRMFILLLLGILCITGCRNSTEQQKQEAIESFENLGIEHETVVRNVLSKKWKVRDSETIYEFSKDGTGNRSGETFTYDCRFSEDHRIMVTITMEQSGEVSYYELSSDNTGHGLFFESLSDENKIHLLNAQIQLLEMSDERVQDLIGAWADKSDNRYIFNDDFSMLIRGKQSDTDGAYSAVIKDEQLLLTLVFEGNTLEYIYELSADGKSLNLQVPGTDVVHTWVKKS